MTIKKILIANRGEVTRRIIKSANSLNIKTLALYTEAEKNNPFYKEASEAVLIKGDSLLDSYLNQEQIIKLAKKYSCDAIHPGYGFLSENGDFAKKVRDNNIIFIGPNSRAIKLMGSKAKAKELLNKIGIPCIEGFSSKNIQSNSELVEKSLAIGFPLLIKASAGGGGKGMRIVRNSEELISSISVAKAEAKKSFGNSDLIIEKYIENPRHIEVQVLGDKFGNIIHLYERHCSLQRRYQKIIEEAPASFLSDTVKSVLYDYSISIAKNINYSSLGTIEFLLDNQDNIYFIEMNTRLQVEHVVTEMITSNDLVALQIEVENNINLDELSINKEILGHSIQARVYAETPENNFLPASGKIKILELPEDLENLRLEHALYQDSYISNSFDPMLLKAVSFGNNRKKAIEILREALIKTSIIGINTNISFLLNCIDTKTFKKDNYSTTFILDTELERKKLKENELTLKEALFKASQYLFNLKNLSLLAGFRLNKLNSTNFKFEYEEEIYSIDIFFEDKTFKEAYLNQELIKDDKNTDFKIFKTDHFIYVKSIYKNYKFKIVEKLEVTGLNLVKNNLSAPMNATVSKILIKEGEVVEENQLLIILEAMKMELEIKSPYEGLVESILCNEKSQVIEGASLIKISEKK